MEAQPEYRELLKLFSENKVEYLIVGGYAVAFHGVPRFTGDMDLYTNPTGENAARILKALDDFGFGDLGLNPTDFTTSDQIVQLGTPPVRINILTSIHGVSWETAWNNRVLDLYGGISVTFIGREELIRNKRRSGRMKDLADIEALGEM